jgi:hypothetical protein
MKIDVNEGKEARKRKLNEEVRTSIITASLVSIKSTATRLTRILREEVKCFTHVTHRALR